MKITLKDYTNRIRVTTGFSWKYFFFGIFYPIFRGDFKGLLIQLVLAFCTCGLAFLVFPFTYNKAYIKRLISQGYVAGNDSSESWLELNLNYDRS